MDCDAKGRSFAEVETRITVGRGPGLSFSAYMGWKDPSAGRRNLSKVVEPENIVFDYFQRQERVSVPPLPPEVRKGNFDAYQATLTAERARQESRRCIHCGRCTGCDNCLVFCPDLSVRVSSNGGFGYAIDYDYCKGCGICAAECPRNAITMFSEEFPIDQEET
jgi:2-oxoacid:acceptor oxidoreductase delta subunit (pyruvate/2-ketoisovalerate family)